MSEKKKSKGRPPKYKNGVVSRSYSLPADNYKKADAEIKAILKRYE